MKKPNKDFITRSNAIAGASKMIGVAAAG